MLRALLDETAATTTAIDIANVPVWAQWVTGVGAGVVALIPLGGMIFRALRRQWRLWKQEEQEPVVAEQPPRREQTLRTFPKQESFPPPPVEDSTRERLSAIERYISKRDWDADAWREHAREQEQARHEAEAEVQRQADELIQARGDRDRYRRERNRARDELERVKEERDQLADQVTAYERAKTDPPPPMPRRRGD